MLVGHLGEEQQPRAEAIGQDRAFHLNKYIREAVRVKPRVVSQFEMSA